MCKESTFKSVRNINTRETSCRFAGEERGVFGIRTQFWQVQHSCIGEQSKDNLPMDYKPCDPATCKFLPWSDLFFISKATLDATKVVRIDHPEYGLSIQAWGDKMPNAIKLKSPARFFDQGSKCERYINDEIHLPPSDVKKQVSVSFTDPSDKTLKSHVLIVYFMDPKCKEINEFATETLGIDIKGTVLVIPKSKIHPNLWKELDIE